MQAIRPILLAALLCGCLLPLYCPPVNSDEQTIRVALFVDAGAQASEFRKEFQRSDDNSITYKNVDGDAIASGALKNFDVLLVPGGSARREALSMGSEARQEVRRFVDGGGIYMGVCAGAYLASQVAKTDLGLLPLKTQDPDHWYRVDDATRVDVELTPSGMEIFGIPERNIRVKYENGPIFAPPAEKPDDGLTPLGFFASEVVGDGGERGVMTGAPAIIFARYGRGLVMAISPHFEETPGYKQVQLHALHWLYQHRYSADSAQPGNSTPQENSTLQENSALQENSTEKKKTASNTNSKVGDQALQLARSIFDNAEVVRYVHRDVLAARQIFTRPDGTMEALTDCSGFISYIIHNVAPRHYSVVRSREPDWGYPQAKVWARFFASLDSDQPTEGWLAIADWQKLQPGDLIAWEEGKKTTSHNTGHVMLVAGRPSKVQEEGGVRYFAVPVIDSSTVYHFSPESLPPKAAQSHRNGVGMGIVRIVLSDDNQPIGYWAGTYWGEGQEPVEGPTMSRLVRFARMISLAN